MLFGHGAVEVGGGQLFGVELTHRADFFDPARTPRRHFGLHGGQFGFEAFGSQAAMALRNAPANPLITMLEVLGRRAEDQQPNPVALRVGGNVCKSAKLKQAPVHPKPGIRALNGLSVETFHRLIAVEFHPANP